ncbi:protein RKD3-like [Miscanthus floridulus]|uniref:protein RKD3-like n=1 Tax=Miscanthus floridulus TaxID=154761 RepID=UPI0034594717
MPSSVIQQHSHATDPSSSISRRKKCTDDMVWFIHLPMRQAAKALGMSCAMIQRTCRSNGIQRWPSRKIGALDRKILKLEKNMFLPRDRVKRTKMLDEWKKLSRERMDIYCNFMSLI